MTKNGKPLLCPNCFGTDYREVLATATSRNVVEDDSAPAATGPGIGRRRELVRLYCLHCGHEFHNRA